MAINDVKPTQPAPYKAKDVSAPIAEYDAMRSRLGQRVNADTQQQQDAMQRRFAAQGGLNSGAAIKQQQLVAEAGAQNREQAMEGINSQESAERRRMQEAEAQKEFQSQEAGAQRQFAASESQLGRDFQKGMFDTDLAFKEKWATIGQGNTARQLDMAAEQLGLAKDEAAFNKLVALSGMDDDELLGMGGTGDAYREQKASKKGEIENAKNRAEYDKMMARRNGTY
jgi:hypothetical protein